jgi:hypothetical protein
MSEEDKDERKENRKMTKEGKDDLTEKWEERGWER